MLDRNFTIVDVETTGLSPQADRIIELGALVVEQGKWVKSYSTFINPERPLPPFISNLTGIQEEQLKDAPTFSQVAEEVESLFQGRILVAHNARFDHGFIRNELKRAGRELNSKPLCTVRLSRKLFPRARGHGLDKLIGRLGITCAKRHRAFDDAQVLWEFLKIIQERFSSEEIQPVLAKLLKTTSYPPGLDAKRVQDLPEGPGVYIFYNDKGAPLYVGKSIHVRERVLSHFSSDHTRGAEMSLCRQTTDIEALCTAGELGALLLESHLIKKLQPWFNRKSRESQRLVVLRKKLSSKGYYQVQVEPIQTLETWELEQILGVFRSQKAAKKYLEEEAGEHGLCPKLLNLEKGRGSCFSYQLKKCKGACLQEEESVKYNLRFMEAFQATRIQQWPYPGPIRILEKKLDTKENESFLVDQWCLVGRIEHDELSQEGVLLGKYTFDYESYKILKRYLREPKNKKNIRSVRIPSNKTGGQIPLL